MSAPQQVLDRWADGERLFATALGRLTDEEFDGASLLPGWDRRHVAVVGAAADGRPHGRVHQGRQDSAVQRSRRVQVLVAHLEGDPRAAVVGVLDPCADPSCETTGGRLLAHAAALPAHGPADAPAGLVSRPSGP